MTVNTCATRGGRQEKNGLPRAQPRDRDPTQAVDVAARRDILDVISDAAQGGMPVLFASLEAADLAAVCHRIVVFRNGGIATTISTHRRDDVIEQIYAGQLGRRVRAEESEQCTTT